MGCAIIQVNSKQLVIKSNYIINVNANSNVNETEIKNKLYNLNQIEKNKNKNNSIKNHQNNLKKIIPILWLNIVDYLDQKDLKEARKINRYK
jgi:hypothetical protein